MTTTAPAPPPVRRGRYPRPLTTAGLGLGGALIGMAVLASALRYGGALEAAIPGLPTPGAFTSWGLPFSTGIATAAGTIAIGTAVVGAVLVPGSTVDTPGTAPASCTWPGRW